MTRKEEVKRLLEKSREFMETASFQVERGFYSLAVFSLEQALQLFLKAKLLEEGVLYPRIHSIRRLLRMLAEVSPSRRRYIEKLLEKYAVELGCLEDAYITSRYAPREFEREEVLRLRQVVEEVMKTVT